eukprot:365571-Chlamydomonas_euryale.AAC.11
MGVISAANSDGTDEGAALAPTKPACGCAETSARRMGGSSCGSMTPSAACTLRSSGDINVALPDGGVDAELLLPAPPLTRSATVCSRSWAAAADDAPGEIHGDGSPPSCPYVAATSIIRNVNSMARRAAPSCSASPSLSSSMTHETPPLLPEPRRPRESLTGCCSCWLPCDAPGSPAMRRGMCSTQQRPASACMHAAAVCV